MRTALLLIFTTITLATQAQTSVYHPFPDSDAVWNVTYGYGDPFSCFDIIHYSYTIGNDTLIGSFVYHKIIIPDSVNLSSLPCGGNFPYIGYQGGIRQDTIEKRVYLMERDSTTEKLLYDFNLKIGDTLKYDLSKWLICSPLIFTVQEIDSILIGNNYRRSFLFSGVYSNGYTIIEGIGSNNGLLEWPCASAIETGVELLCFQQNGITLYPDSTTNCNIITEVKNVMNKNIFLTLFPNPFHSSATLTTNFEKAELKIYNIFGMLAREEKITNQSKTIYRNSLANGIYFYQLVSENGQIASGKFVVE